MAQAVALSPGPAGHVAAVLASLLVLLALLLAALLYVKCRLNVLLWYQDAYGEVEMNGAWGQDGQGGRISDGASLSSVLGGRVFPDKWGGGGGVDVCSGEASHSPGKRAGGEVGRSGAGDPNPAMERV